MQILSSNQEMGEIQMNTFIDKLALVLIIIGAINWGLVGILQIDLVAWLFGGSAALISRVIYTLIAAGGIWSLTFLFRDEPMHRSI